jgi:hypothetical protein
MLIMRIISILLAAIILTTSSLSWSRTERRDGEWWMSLNKSSKHSYISGYIDGMKLGNIFSCQKYEINSKDYSDCIKLTDRSYQEYDYLLFSNVTDNQLSAELDNFYENKKNRRIFVFNAVWIAANRISGMPEAEINKLILRSRAISSN